MLLPDNIHPENSIYYNGMFLIEALNSNGDMDILELYQEVKVLKNMTFPVLVFSIDWLYLAGIAELIDGRIRLCS